MCSRGLVFHKYLRAAGPQGRIGLLLPAQAAAVRAHSSGSAADSSGGSSPFVPTQRLMGVPKLWNFSS